MSNPLIPGVYIREATFGTHSIAGAGTATTGFVGLAAQGPAHQAVAVTSFGEFERVFGNLVAQAELGYAVSLFFANGGQQARIVRVNSLSEVPKALGALDTTAIGMLCVPGCADLTILGAVLAYCGEHRVFAVVDPPSSDLAATLALASTLQASGTLNSALYFPPLKIADPLNANAPRQASPSGAVAGMIARVDLQHGTWSPPAGNQAPLMALTGVALTIDQARADSLAAAGVNAILFRPPAGYVVWKAQTLSTQDQWKYVAIRRYVLYVEESLMRGLQWAVFEPNDALLWSQLKIDVAAFMSGERSRGALGGVAADQAFFIKSGREVMAEADISNGRALMLVGFTPAGSTGAILLQVTVQTR